MAQTSSRDRVLAVLLPAILIVAGYVTLVSRTSVLDASQKETAAVRETAVDDDDVEFERIKLAKLTGETEALNSAKKQLDVRRSTLAAVGSSSSILRTQALRQLSGMLWDRGLYTFEESALEGEAAALSPSFDEVLRKLSETSQGQASHERRLWKIRFYGRYGDVLETLETLRDSKSPVIPISLNMSETRVDTEWRSWTLLLWI